MTDNSSEKSSWSSLSSWSSGIRHQWPVQIPLELLFINVFLPQVSYTSRPVGKRLFAISLCKRSYYLRLQSKMLTFMFIICRFSLSFEKCISKYWKLHKSLAGKGPTGIQNTKHLLLVRSFTCCLPHFNENNHWSVKPQMSLI